MNELGFKDSLLPALEPLRSSLAVDDVERELNDLFVSVFDAVSKQAFDAINAGAPHLGTLDLVRRAITADGIAFPDVQGVDASLRYLHKAWSAQNGQGRGVHFLRTYLQALFKNGWTVFQLQVPSDKPYPFGGLAWTPGSELQAGYFLTSRLYVGLSSDAYPVENIEGLIAAISSTLPARFVPSFLSYANAESKIRTAFSLRSSARKNVDTTPLTAHTTINAQRMVLSAQAGVKKNVDTTPLVTHTVQAYPFSSLSARLSMRKTVATPPLTSHVAHSAARHVLAMRPALRQEITANPQVSVVALSNPRFSFFVKPAHRANLTLMQV